MTFCLNVFILPFFIHIISCVYPACLKEVYDKFVKKKDYINALPIAKKLVIIRGQIGDWMAQAKCESLLGYYKDAIKSYSEIVKIDDKNAIAWTNLGGLLGGIAMYDQALSCLNRVVELEPGSWLMDTSLKIPENSYDCYPQIT